MEWNYNDVESNVQDTIDNIKGYINKLAQVQLEPSMSEDEFKQLLKIQNEYYTLSSKLGCYVSLRLSANVNDHEARSYQSQLDTLSVEASEKIMHISHWFKGLPTQFNVLDDDNAKRLFAVNPQLTYMYTYAREQAKYTLPLESEQIMHAKDVNGTDALTELYDVLCNGFEYTVELPEGPKTFKTQQEVVTLVHSPDKLVRKAAYQALFKPYKKHQKELFIVYNAIVRDWAYERRKRGYKSSMAVRNVANHLPDKVIDTLLTTCREHVHIFQRYFKVKGKLLGENLTRYDIYAPLGEQTQISYEDGVKQVENVFGKFSETFRDYAMTIVNGHLDAFPREGKRSGAFCMSVTPEITPYVLSNYNGTHRDVLTLAHELGHGVHDMYASGQPIEVMHAPLPLCETASTFGEMLMFQHFMKTLPEHERKQLLIQKLGEAYATIIRQTYFVVFEQQAHNMLEKGATVEELSDAYYALLKEQFGDMHIPEEFRYEWAYIPHIYHTPFYCYAYNFGDLLSLALYGAYETDPEFMTKLETILKAGGSREPIQLLKECGFDITQKTFWENSFKVIEGLIDELESL